MSTARALPGTLVVLAVLLAGACSDGPVPTPSPASDGQVVEPAPDVPTVRATATSLIGDLPSPWGLAALPDGRLLSTSRDEGTVSLLDPGTGRVTTVTGEGADDLASGTDHGGEGGLLGVAVAPTFAEDGSVVVYRTGEAGNEVLRGRLDVDEARLGALTTVLEGIPKASNHNGGQVSFGPDGFLYVATGDATTSGAAQDPGSLAGKILRVGLDGEAAPGNPDGSRVWSLGHRNVQGLGWDASGRMFASEFGQSTLDELNVIVPGGNYGWPDREGTLGEAAAADGTAFVDPVATWPTSDASPSGLAVAADAVYVAGLRGERLWRVPFAGGAAGEVEASPVPDGGASPAAFGVPQALLTGEWGRLRAVVVAPESAGDAEGGTSLLVLTNETDGRGSPVQGDDHLLRVDLATG
ncbi:PQQ-dependent sugar dehydrogenase [Oerskovia enterophila]|uniref:Quinoprotein glucose dehydrogenase B n=1 Tax=Oerskovia enterophila TaxID=43678 RepID=A0ABX2Y881_9CELL|nr:PQQ-dependent sugar dehydrogenase [Oerskovia enterophila]OCI32641.1 quinoprotein glucose dehydrogenase B precursor [Oerskovia enterophila]